MSDKEEWRNLAAQLGFEFKEDIDAFLDSPNLRRAALDQLGRGDFQQAEKLMRSPWIKKLLDSVFIGMAAGSYKGFEFALFRGTSSSGSGSSSRTVHHVNISMFFPEELRCDLEVYPRGPFTGLGRMFFPGSYVKISNNPELSGLIAVKAKDKGQAAVYMADRNLQAGLLQLFRRSNQFKMTDHGVRYRRKGKIIGREEALPVMDLMVEVGKVF